jgi:hypothetical protein
MGDLNEGNVGSLGQLELLGLLRVKNATDDIECYPSKSIFPRQE